MESAIALDICAEGTATCTTPLEFNPVVALVCASISSAGVLVVPLLLMLPVRSPVNLLLLSIFELAREAPVVIVLLATPPTVPVWFPDVV